MKNIISITDARKAIFDIAEKVQKKGNHYIFTENGKAKIAVMSAEEYENLMEDLALMQDKKFMARMKKSEEEFKRGEFVSWHDVKRRLHIKDKESNLLVADKPKKKYSTKRKKSDK